ncbi:MAG: type II secretion system protein [Desulfobacteraceae bacterium]|nr:type II secretion system protein [Desulfobacteraceae bacterium]MBC2718908.1 type II secretion system protein [Desulfobacteraceae bacterium]
MPTRNEQGFTLLEVLIVLFILGMIAAMAWPALGILDDRAREELTRENMEVIRRAIVGDPDRFDADGRRIIGGYVGDMEKWPDLWEANADIKPDYAGPLPPPGPTWTFGYRPFGHFEGKKWKWDYPFRKLFDADDDHDHIGGLETENEGQPRGLWTQYLEEHPTSPPGEMEGAMWKGPYMLPPADEKPSDSQHWAKTDDEYDCYDGITGLEPKWNPAILEETWEDGDYNAALGEHYDEKESFRLLQTDGRLADGWGRALRFFITADQDRPGSTIFWIISEGPDREGTYPTKGTFAAGLWTIDPDDIMSKAYDEEDDYNKDNIVMKIYSHEWEAIFDEINEKKKMETETLFLRIKRAILGSSPGRMNDGFTGDVCGWPKLFRWEDNGTPANPNDDYWDDEDGIPVSYTKGQLRELWTRTPNSSDPGDNVAVPAWAHAGMGWRGEYLQTPWGINGEQYIRDAWDREVLFFKDNTNDAIMILSRGVDGKFDFYSTNAEKTEPVNFTEVIDIVVTPYDPNDAGGYNADNIVLIVRKSDWYPGFFTLNKFTVLNAILVTTKACLFYDDGNTDIKVAGTDGSMIDADGDLAVDDWELGAAPPPPYAFNYTDITVDKIKAGARYLVFWDDADGNDTINVGENQYTAIYNIITSNSMEPRDNITVDSSVDFSAAP